ncbi:3-hydroxyacyl-CoA dehydrogenase [Neorhizobium sp. 2083]|uniref:3-hydroxyacyl-CoA dehydrogenase NAD-binding domain-containing protein n=1 Tax=Neorhizobium sp. 2083 TaxID=2817762 RepID=UPI00285A7E57|nr:3-hydroxyacyl-CoA dehydrogenase NAD-binding domain-containing protein [Neorhizobium sp. 2083]MDR6817485.1 3-hydroxyacyl-CoA dehydrogenase [Neorhizobium sp. 2083]
MPFVDQNSVTDIAIIGAGTIGASWASYFLARGFRCRVSDPAPDVPERVRTFVTQSWGALTELETATTSIDDALSRLSFWDDPVTAVAGAQFTQENLPEKLDLKRDMLKRLDAALAADRIIASSTSGLTASSMQESMAHPERLVIGHPFNPPHLMPLVEVVGGERTSAEAIRWTADFYDLLGKKPIVLKKEVPGHIANRLQAALWREAVHLVLEGVGSVEDVDKAVSLGPGLRWAFMGQHMIFHLGGGEGGMGHFIDHIGPAVQTWWNDLGSPDVSPGMRAALLVGLREATEGRGYSELAEWRDEKLVRLLKTLRPQAE